MDLATSPHIGDCIAPLWCILQCHPLIINEIFGDDFQGTSPTVLAWIDEQILLRLHNNGFCSSRSPLDSSSLMKLIDLIAFSECLHFCFPSKDEDISGNYLECEEYISVLCKILRSMQTRVDLATTLESISMDTIKNSTANELKFFDVDLDSYEVDMNTFTRQVKTVAACLQATFGEHQAVVGEPAIDHASLDAGDDRVMVGSNVDNMALVGGAADDAIDTADDLSTELEIPRPITREECLRQTDGYSESSLGSTSSSADRRTNAKRRRRQSFRTQDFTLLNIADKESDASVVSGLPSDCESDESDCNADVIDGIEMVEILSLNESDDKTSDDHSSSVSYVYSAGTEDTDSQSDDSFEFRAVRPKQTYLLFLGLRLMSRNRPFDGPECPLIWPMTAPEAQHLTDARLMSLRSRRPQNRPFEAHIPEDIRETSSFPATTQCQILKHWTHGDGNCGYRAVLRALLHSSRGVPRAAYLMYTTNITMYRIAIKQFFRKHVARFTGEGSPLYYRIAEPTVSGALRDAVFFGGTNDEVLRNVTRQLYLPRHDFDRDKADVPQWACAGQIFPIVSMMEGRTVVLYDNNKKNQSTSIWHYDKVDTTVTFYCYQGYFTPPQVRHPPPITILFSGNHFEHVEVRQVVLSKMYGYVRRLLGSAFMLPFCDRSRSGWAPEHFALDEAQPEEEVLPDGKVIATSAVSDDSDGAGDDEDDISRDDGSHNDTNTCTPGFSDSTLARLGSRRPIHMYQHYCQTVTLDGRYVAYLSHFIVPRNVYSYSLLKFVPQIQSDL